ncbi:MAG: transposase [Chthoniobacterales bacterium]|nr:transposase [Chthoniobacterales bacterium]
MARKGRVEFAGAIYQVLDRGDRREAIFADDQDRLTFLRTLGQVCWRTGWRLHAYVLMSNHYHFLLETPGGQPGSADEMVPRAPTRYASTTGRHCM